VRDIEQQLIEEIAKAMQARKQTQAAFASSKNINRQAVNPYFTGRKSLLTETGKDLLEFLGVRIKLEVIDDNEARNKIIGVKKI
jgi:transcriptional regulator with XRE-family HTH domain